MSMCGGLSADAKELDAQAGFEKVCTAVPLLLEGADIIYRHNFRRHWQPGILSRDTYETWQAKGETIEQICRRKAQDILAQHQPPLPAGVEAELERIVRRYLGLTGSSMVLRPEFMILQHEMCRSAYDVLHGFEFDEAVNMILGFTLKDENVVALSIARGIVLLGAEWNPRL